MKKNTMMRIASVVLVLTLLSTCAISGTFAKYTTSAEANESARVAKWGVAISATSDAFKAAYNKDDSTYAGTVTVSASEDVVAPGTSGTLAAVDVTGVPEVATRISYTATLELGDNWVAGGEYYCPLVITIGDDAISGLDYTTVAEFETAVNEAINAFTADYDAGTDLSAIDNITNPVVTWEWAFEGNDDVKDTALGDAAATGTAATINLDMTVTATQIN